MSPMGDPQKDACEARQVSNQDKLEWMVDNTDGIIALVHLVRDMQFYLQRARVKLLSQAMSAMVVDGHQRAAIEHILKEHLC